MLTTTYAQSHRSTFVLNNTTQFLRTSQVTLTYSIFLSQSAILSERLQSGYQETGYRLHLCHLCNLSSRFESTFVQCLLLSIHPIFSMVVLPLFWYVPDYLVFFSKGCTYQLSPLDETQQTFYFLNPCLIYQHINHRSVVE